MCVTNRTTQILYVLVDWLMFLVFPVWKLGGNCKKLRFQGQSFGVLIITHIVSQFQSQLSFFLFVCLFVLLLFFFLSVVRNHDRRTEERFLVVLDLDLLVLAVYLIIISTVLFLFPTHLSVPFALSTCQCYVCEAVDDGTAFLSKSRACR